MLERALTVAGIIPRTTRSGAPIHALTRRGMLDELSRRRLQPLGNSIELLNVFLGNSHDKAITESVALGVLDVAKENGPVSVRPGTGDLRVLQVHSRGCRVQRGQAR